MANWDTAENIWDEFVERADDERERYRMGNGLDFVNQYGAAAVAGRDRSMSKLIHGDKLAMIKGLTRRRLGDLDNYSDVQFKTVPTDWKPQGQMFITSGQAPKIKQVRGRMFEQAKLYVTGTYADNRIVGGEYLMATGRRRRRLGFSPSMAVVEDRIGGTAEGRAVVKVFRAVKARCTEKREELMELSGKGSQQAKDEGLEQVARMELMVYRCINKLMN